MLQSKAAVCALQHNNCAGVFGFPFFLQEVATLSYIAEPGLQIRSYPSQSVISRLARVEAL